MLGVPHRIKTDNGPGYISARTQAFLASWGVQHIIGIPHSPQGQAVVERAHRTLKSVLEKQKGGMLGETPYARLQKALYLLNHLTLADNDANAVSNGHSNPVMLKHFLSLTPLQVLNSDQKAQVLIKSLESTKWEGPFDLITWGRGYACVSTD